MNPDLCHTQKNEAGGKEQKLLSELETLYERLEQELKTINPHCNMCGMCCNFTVFDHILYASNLEVAYIIHHQEVLELNISRNVCPFLKNNKCTIRDHRMLACRTFYCNERYKKSTQALYEKYYCFIKELYRKYNIEWTYRPFLVQLDKYKT